MNLNKLLGLSILPEYQIFGSKRTKFLNDFEDLLNSPKFNPNFVDVSTASLIGKNMNINSPNYWKELSYLVIKNIHKANKKNSDAISVIHRNYMIKFPVIGDNFFETLEFKMFEMQDYLNNLSVTNLGKGICARATTNEKILTEIERLFVKRMRGFNKQDLAMLGYCMTLNRLFGTGIEFKKELENLLNSEVNDSNIFMLVNILRGISSRGWYFEKFIMEAVKILEKNSDRLGYIQITQASWAIAEFNKGIEIPLLEKIMDRRL